MKNKIILSLLILLPFFLLADLITEITAKGVASVHLNITNNQNNYSLGEITHLKDDNEVVLAYIVHLTPKGFIVVSAETEIVPIIAYSFNSNFISDPTPKNIFYHLLKKDLELRNEAIKNDSYSANEKIKELRKNYQNNVLTYFKNLNFKQWPYLSNFQSNGLIQTTWHQNEPYNKFCPLDSLTQKRTGVGSAGISLAQLINYHYYIKDVSFTSSDSYITKSGINIDQDHIKNDFLSFNKLNKYLLDINRNFHEKKKLTSNEISALCFACAVSVNVHFNTDNTDSWTWDIAHALRNKFGYSQAKVIYPDNLIFFTEIQENIKNKMPVNLVIIAQNEFSFICDGYNTFDEYHLNFGWTNEKQTTTDAWYSFLPQINSKYNIISQAIINIGKNVSVRLKLNNEKIILSDDNILVDFLENDEVEKKTTDKKTKESINEALEEKNLPEFGLTPKFVIYEDEPVPVKRIPPDYPPHIHKSGIEGTVILEVEVLENGKVGGIEVVRSLMTGKGGLDEAAVNAVKQWEFVPAKNGGKPVACWVRFPIKFELN